MQNNYQDENMLFLREKIRDIRVALFKSETNSELRLPNNIIQTLKVNDDGTILFFTSCTGDHAKNIDRSFYAYLDYYKKGTGCRLRLGGRATIIDDEDEALLTMSDYSKGLAGRLVLVSMKIMQAEYFENKPSNVSWKDKFKVAFNHLFLSPSHKIYDFS